MNPKTQVRLIAIMTLSVLLALVISGCDKSNPELERSARDLAVEFHGAIGEGNLQKINQLIDFPFLLDEKVVNDEEEFTALFLKKKSAIRRAVNPARKMETCTFEEFLNGKSVAGKSLEEDKAKGQAGKIHFRQEGILVRCYHEKDGVEDGRAYYLVMHPNELGDLKVTTYYD